MIDKYILGTLRRGSGVEGGKHRIYKYYTENKPTQAEFAKFLKDEYGWGGCSHAYTITPMVDPAPGRFIEEMHDGKGITLREFTQQYDPDKELWPCKTVEELTIPWPHVATTISQMILAGTYMPMKDYCSPIAWLNLRKTISAQRGRQ